MTNQEKNDWLQQVNEHIDFHGEANGDSDYCVGDLQILFAVAFKLLTQTQIVSFACDDDVMTLFECFDNKNLLDEIVN